MFNVKYVFSQAALKSVVNFAFKAPDTKLRFFATIPSKIQSAASNSSTGTFTESKRFLAIDNIGSMQSKKRPTRKKWTDELKDGANGRFSVVAFASAEEYNLEALMTGLIKQDLYEPKRFFSSDNSTIEPDVLYVKAKYKVEEEPRDIFFFREGTAVLWNVSEIECSNVLAFLKDFEKDKYSDNLVHEESEVMPYCYQPEQGQALLRTGQFLLSKAQEQDTYLEKYTFSNALSLSVKLGIWEAALDKYINSMEKFTNDLKSGRKINITRHQMLQKTGELFMLKHLINLSSDLLDTPDFYWDREQLEQLYSQTCAYFSITRRTRVMNEKLNHCVELADLISSNLNDKHHIRLEWMIIILIMVEVVFECLHYADRFYGRNDHDSRATGEQEEAVNVLMKTQE